MDRRGRPSANPHPHPSPDLGQTWKTKCVFILVQLLYTVVELLPVVWLGLG